MLIDVLATLVIVGLALGLAFAAVPRGTTSPRLRAIAEEIATALRTARTDALVGGRETLTIVDSDRRMIRAGDQRLQLPPDITLSVLYAETCRRAGASVGVVFRPDGSSCGAVIRIARGSRGFRVRVNWYTGHVEILAA
ncbi:hypothetical protein ASF60_14930 [Methylobacterium sp. Leaf113]|uniref:GspH/FimT family pseudopilin n=1 Tax=Methylobacterium sp. Leaf113 TaxID=1736259 RepID=UPI0006F7EE95|nr:GspH/FimT family pseudopilin [Methylobacterium sp. Leaf113]KQP93237.1 hypothetical protein ASF60_14930 [Methylobacterium sp. Leaf113]